MKSYKVIKSFACAEKGDILEYSEEDGMFLLSESENGNTRFIGMDEESADRLVNEGYMMCFEDDEEEDCDCCEKLQEVSDLIDKLITTYHNNYEEIMKQAEAGKIQPCVRVEAETVYFNINKVLNKIKGIINE